MQNAGAVLGFKSSADPSPPDSRLAADTFALIIQTQYQREVFKKDRHSFASIDTTHNTTHYENMSLFTVIVRDQWGHGECSLSCLVRSIVLMQIPGFPAAWMVSSNATEVTIDFFLACLRKQNLNVIPKKFMSDQDSAQMNAIQHQYIESQLFLCWWHVLHSWQQHLIISHYPALWDLLKKWVRVEEDDEFEVYWTKIKLLAPQSFIEYIETYWLPVKALWSAVAWKNQMVFELCNMNMLVEV